MRSAGGVVTRSCPVRVDRWCRHPLASGRRRLRRGQRCVAAPSPVAPPPSQLGLESEAGHALVGKDRAADGPLEVPGRGCREDGRGGPPTVISAWSVNITPWSACPSRNPRMSAGAGTSSIVPAACTTSGTRKRTTWSVPRGPTGAPLVIPDGRQAECRVDGDRERHAEPLALVVARHRARRSAGRRLRLGHGSARRPPSCRNDARECEHGDHRWGYVVASLVHRRRRRRSYSPTSPRARRLADRCLQPYGPPPARSGRRPTRSRPERWRPSSGQSLTLAGLRERVPGPFASNGSAHHLPNGT